MKERLRQTLKLPSNNEKLNQNMNGVTEPIFSNLGSVQNNNNNNRQLSHISLLRLFCTFYKDLYNQVGFETPEERRP